jgi:Tfp pilus assembly protein PilP
MWRTAFVACSFAALLLVGSELPAQEAQEEVQQEEAQEQAAPVLRPRSAVPSGERRDPFRALMQLQAKGVQDAPPPCPPGIRGILIGQTDLSGVVETPSGFLAVITARNNKRTYFLREGNTLCNGRVARITPDAIVFEENVVDPLGKPGTREVIRRIPTDSK